MAFYGMTFNPGDRILTARAEYASNVIAFLQVARRTGAIVEVVDNDESGQLSVGDLSERLSDRPRSAYASSRSRMSRRRVGWSTPLRRSAPPAASSAFHTCSTHASPSGSSPSTSMRSGATCSRQPAGSSCAVRAASASCTSGASFLPQIEPPFLDLHAARWTAPDAYEIRPDARRFENWETNYAAKIGLGVAIDYALVVGPESDRDTRHRARRTAAREAARGRLALTVHDLGVRRSGIVTFTVEGQSADSVFRALSASRRQRQRLQGRVRPARSDHRDQPDLVRASVHYYNTEDELDRLVAALPAPARED